MIDVIKRTGARVKFDKKKIQTAINKAFIEVDGTLFEDETASAIAEEIENSLIKQGRNEISIEEIQDEVEKELMTSERSDVAKAYIRYRYKKEVARNSTDDFITAIREKLDATNVQNQNANVDEQSFGGRTGEASGVVTKKLALDYICSEMARNNHLNNEIYIHKLNCA